MYNYWNTKRWFKTKEFVPNLHSQNKFNITILKQIEVDQHEGVN